MEVKPVSVIVKLTARNADGFSVFIFRTEERRIGNQDGLNAVAVCRTD